MRDSLSLPWRRRPGAALPAKVCHYLRPKLHPLLLDAGINAPRTVRLNIYQVRRPCLVQEAPAGDRAPGRLRLGARTCPLHRRRPLAHPPTLTPSHLPPPTLSPAGLPSGRHEAALLCALPAEPPLGPRPAPEVGRGGRSVCARAHAAPRSRGHGSSRRRRAVQHADAQAARQVRSAQRRPQAAGTPRLRLRSALQRAPPGGGSPATPRLPAIRPSALLPPLSAAPPPSLPGGWLGTPSTTCCRAGRCPATPSCCARCASCARCPRAAVRVRCWLRQSTRSGRPCSGPSCTSLLLNSHLSLLGLCFKSATRGLCFF